MSNLQIKLMCSNINLDENAELKKITFEDWVKIFNIFKSHASPKSHSLILGKYNALLEEQANLKKVNRTRIDR